MKKVILVTGASSGIGYACATALHLKGHIVYGSTRDLKRISTVPFRPIQLDVTDDASVSNAIEKIITAQGKLDVLVNNAGNCIAGPAYTMPVATAKKQFEVNFFGVVRMCSAVLPGMIGKKQGLIVNISSLAGLSGWPYQSMYSASKFAIEGYSDTLRMELRSTGVKVVVINPGDMKSGFAHNGSKTGFVLDDPGLEQDYENAVSKAKKDKYAAPGPEALARKLCGIVESRNPAHRYFSGKLAQTMIPTLKYMLPAAVFDKLMNGYYGVRSR